MSSSWRARRLEAGLSLRELERRTGINRGRLSTIERGLPASPEEAEAILDALGVSTKVAPPTPTLHP